MRVAVGWLFLVALALAHTPGIRPIEPPPPPPPPPRPDGPVTPNGGAPPGLRDPDPDPPETPRPTGPPPPDSGGADPIPPQPTPPPAQPPENTPPPRSRAKSRTYTSWRVWWEYNREYLLGVRRTVRAGGTVTPTATDDPAAGAADRVFERAHARKVLAGITASVHEPKNLRGTTAMALGRIGNENDAEVLLRILRRGKAPSFVQIGAALGIGILPVESHAVRARIRKHLDELMRARNLRPHKVRGFLALAMGLRAGEDRGLAMDLVQHCQRARGQEEAANLVFACGISREPMLLGEILGAAKSGRLGRQRLGDVGRSHAATAAGLLRSPRAVALLVQVLRSRRARVQTRRSAALALGRLLREAPPTGEDLRAAKRAFVRALTKDSDAPLRAFAAIALGGAREPMALDELRRIVDKGGNPIVKPYAALALGLGARHAPHRDRDSIRAFLALEYKKAHDPELVSALGLACALAGAQAAQPLLLERAQKGAARARAAAAEALGLLGGNNPEVPKLLESLLKEGRPEAAGGAAMGLGLMGRRGASLLLLERLRKESSAVVQGRLVLALAHLGQVSSIAPLLEIVADKKRPEVVRELAAVAVGMIGDPRDEDRFLVLDAYTNYFATTEVTRAFLTIY